VLEDEDRRLKKLLAEAMLDNAALKDPRKKRLDPAARRAAVTRLIAQHRLSRVRACRLVGLNRSSLNYQSKRPDDSRVRQRLRELAAERRRFGYRRLGWLLAREGHVMNRKKLYRIYSEEKLTVRRRGRRKRALGTRTPLAPSRCDQSALVTRLRVRCGPCVANS
jgi:putative transposase